MMEIPEVSWRAQLAAVAHWKRKVKIRFQAMTNAINKAPDHNGWLELQIYDGHSYQHVVPSSIGLQPCFWFPASTGPFTDLDCD